MMDVSLAPLLWRLPHLGVTLPDEASAVHEYAERLFARPGFQESLTGVERAMRAA
jgi:RNA polymerase-associated protein